MTANHKATLTNDEKRETMEVSYRNSFGDFIQFHLQYMFSSKISLAILGLVLFPIGHLALDVARGVHLSAFGKVIAFSVVLVFGFGIFLLFISIVIFIAAFFSYRAYNAKWGECKIQVTEKVLLAESSVARSEIQWAGIEAIKQSKSLILIYVTKSMAYLVPKRAFTNETAANQFFTYISELWRKHKHKSDFDKSLA